MGPAFRLPEPPSPRVGEARRSRGWDLEARLPRRAVLWLRQRGAGCNKSLMYTETGCASLGAKFRCMSFGVFAAGGVLAAAAAWPDTSRSESIHRTTAAQIQSAAWAEK